MHGDERAKRAISEISDHIMNSYVQFQKEHFTLLNTNGSNITPRKETLTDETGYDIHCVYPVRLLYSHIYLCMVK